MKRLFIILFTLVISQVTLAQIKVLSISAAGWSEDETTVITFTCPTDIDVTTNHCFEAYDIESEPVEEEVQPEFPTVSLPPTCLSTTSPCTVPGRTPKSRKLI